jgi:fatty-acid desaturase
VLSKAIQQRKFILGSLIGVVTFHILALLALFTFSWPGFIVFLVMVFVTGCLGITLGYHRLLTHRSFETSKPLKYLLAFFGCLAMQGGPIRWVATHRLHHKEADKPNDPHSAEEGFLWSHLLWNFYRHEQLESAEDLHRFAPDMEKDPVLRFLDKYFFFLFLAVAALLFIVGMLVDGWQLGLSLVVWGCMLRVVYVWHITWLVNSATHLWGYQTFNTKDNSRNNWWVALLTFGEGWHNNHHAFQRSSRMGFAWYEFDVTFWIIQFLQRMGLARNLVDSRPNSKLLVHSQDKLFRL